jgi:hypothetical protein
MNLWVPENVGKFLAERVAASQEGLTSMELVME